MYTVLTFVVEAACDNALWSVKFSDRACLNTNFPGYCHKCKCK